MRNERIDILFLREGISVKYADSPLKIKVIYNSENNRFFNGETTVKNNEITVLAKKEDLPELELNKTIEIYNTIYYIIDWEEDLNPQLLRCYISKDRV